VLANVAFEDFGEMEAVLDRLSSAKGLAGVELNISCPNVAEGGMAFGCVPSTAAEATALARRAWKGPLWVKLTPQAPDPAAVARAVEAAGADALVAANTWTGAAMDLRTGRPAFRRVAAGLSGPAIFPLALWLLMRIVPAVSIPVLGCGGVCRGEDVLAMLLAGARAVELGTVLFADESAPRAMIGTVGEYMRDRGYGSLQDFCRRPR
jgi:dihydroorotate dehydrogenase (NAD+) catalytic subunit